MGALLRLVGRAQLSFSLVTVCGTATSLAFGFLICKEKRHKFGVPQDFPRGKKKILGLKDKIKWIIKRKCQNALEDESRVFFVACRHQLVECH